MKKIVVIISVLVVALLAAAELYVQSDAFALRIRPLVVDRLQAALGGKAEIGWVKANLIPLYVEVRDISLRDDQGNMIAAVRKVKAYINPFPLVIQRISVPSIVILEPRMILEQSKAGELNISPVIETMKKNLAGSKASGASGGFRISLGTVSVIQGKLSVLDKKNSAQVEANDIHLNVSASALDENLRLTLKRAAISLRIEKKVVFSGTLRTSLEYDHGRIRLDSFELASEDTSVSLSGEVTALPKPVLNLKLSIKSGSQTLGRFFPALRQIIRKERGPQIEASASIRGSIENPSAKGNMRFINVTYRGIQLGDAPLSFVYENRDLELTGENWKLFRGSDHIVVDSIHAGIGFTAQGLEISRFDILAGDLSLQLTGKADLQHGFDAKLVADSSGGRTISFVTAQPIEGRISVKGDVTGEFSSPIFDGVISAGPIAVRGILFDRADGRLRFRDKQISIVSADIRQRSSQYFFDGSADFSGKDVVFSADARVVHSDVASVVALFYRPLPLKLAATGELSFSGSAREYTGNAHLVVDSGSTYGESLFRGSIAASLSKGKITFSRVHVDKGSGIVTGTGWIGFDGTYSASIESRGVKLSEVNLLKGIPADGRFSLTIESSGSFSHPKASAAIHLKKFQYNQIDLGELNTELTLAEKTLTCRALLDRDHADIRARLGLGKTHPWDVQAAVNMNSLDPFAVFSGKELLGSTHLIADGEISLQGRGADVASLSGQASFTRLGLAVGDFQVENVGNAAVQIQEGRLSITTLAFRGPGTNLEVKGGARLLKDMDFKFMGTVHLSLLRVLYREVEHGDGTADVKLTVRDDWKNPDVAGALRINNGEIKIKDIPQKFSALRGKIMFTQNRIIVDSLAGEVGGGALSASGWAQLNGLALRDFSFKSSIENVTVRYPEGLTSTLSGDLYYDGDASEQTLNGEVAIKRAKYDKRVEWKSMLVDIGRGFSHKKKMEVAWIGDTQINIRFYGKEGILLQNNLAKLPLDIDVFLRGTVNQPQLFGRIEALSGTVYFRKNEFNILHASADFVDPNRINPVLDIQAEIQVRADREYRIRLAVSGTADRAVVTLLSDPPLPDSDILTLLALGKTSQELKGKETGVGMSEAYSFATGQLQDIVESRARSLTGLDRFQVDPYVTKGDVSVPRVTVGKEIVRDKLYVTYSSNVGSTTPEQIFRIEYILDRHFSLVGERNELGNTGADVKYHFDFK